MKSYIRHYDEKHWYNFLFEGKVFFKQKKFGFYAMRKSPTIFLNKFSSDVKSISILSKGKECKLNIEGNMYYEAEEGDVIEITYYDGTIKKATIAYNPILNSYCYI